MLRDFLWTKMHTKSYNVTPGQKFKFCENKFLVKVYKSCKNLYSLEKLVRRKKSPKVFLQSLKRAAILKAPKGKSASLDFPLQLQKAETQSPRRALTEQGNSLMQAAALQARLRVNVSLHISALLALMWRRKRDKLVISR